MVNYPQVLAALRDCFGDRASVSSAVRQQHCSTLTWLAGQPPEIVVWPRNVCEVQSIVKIAQIHKVPLVPFGSGTSLEGQVNAPFGGICVDSAKVLPEVKIIQTKGKTITIAPIINIV